MQSQFFKTTAKQRESARATRDARDEKGKPVPKEVDEALSAAIRRAVITLNHNRDPALRMSTLLSKLLDDAERHLIRVRNMDAAESHIAVDERIQRPRRYSKKTRVQPRGAR